MALQNAEDDSSGSASIETDNLMIKPIEYSSEYIEHPWNDLDDEDRRQAIDNQIYANFGVYRESSASEWVERLENAECESYVCVVVFVLRTVIEFLHLQSVLSYVITQRKVFI